MNNVDTEHQTEQRFFTPPLWRQRRSFANRIVCNDPSLHSILDIGCGEGALLEILMNNTKFYKIAGLDIDERSLILASESCAPNDSDFRYLREKPIRLELYKGSVADPDSRLFGYDCITMLEVIEHLNPKVLEKLPSTVFGMYQPRVVIVSTPNAEYNINFENLNYGTPNAQFRHWDHKFEWTRQEFHKWCQSVGEEFGYTFNIEGVGVSSDSVYNVGFCTQIAIFKRELPVTLMVSGTPYELFYEVDFPYFEESGFSDEQIIDNMRRNTDILIPSFHTNSIKTKFTLQEYWGLLEVRQFCKDIEKMVEAIKSPIGAKWFALDEERGIVTALWDLRQSIDFDNEPEQFIPIDIDYDMEDLELDEDEMWYRDYTYKEENNRKRRDRISEVDTVQGKWEVCLEEDENEIKKSKTMGEW